MAFKIPKGKDYTFTITVLAKDSFLPQDLINLDLTKTSFTLVALDTLIQTSGNCTIIRIADNKVNPTDPDTYLNGKLSITIPSTITSTLSYLRGSKVDGYYPIPTYEGIITVTFTDSTSNIIAVIPNICIIPIGI